MVVGVYILHPLGIVNVFSPISFSSVIIFPGLSDLTLNLYSERSTLSENVAAAHGSDKFMNCGSFVKYVSMKRMGPLKYADL